MAKNPKNPKAVKPEPLNPGALNPKPLKLQKAPMSISVSVVLLSGRTANVDALPTSLVYEA